MIKEKNSPVTQFTFTETHENYYKYIQDIAMTRLSTTADENTNEVLRNTENYTTQPTVVVQVK